MIRFRLRLPVLLLLLVTSSPCFGADTPKLTVSGKGANLYAREDNEGKIIATLEPGEILQPMAQGVGAGLQAGNWYLVRTSKGFVGWVQSIDVSGSSRTYEVFRDNSTVKSDRPTGSLAQCLANADEQARRVWAKTCQDAGKVSDCALRGFDADVLKRDHRAARDECIKVLGISKLAPAQ
jgi:Bacterial SH3 domain